MLQGGDLRTYDECSKRGFFFLLQTPACIQPLELILFASATQASSITLFAGCVHGTRCPRVLGSPDACWMITTRPLHVCSVNLENLERLMSTNSTFLLKGAM